MTQRSVRGVEGPQGYSSYPCCSYPFQHRSPHLADRHGFPRGREQKGSVLLCTAATFTSWAAIQARFSLASPATCIFALRSIRSRRGESCSRVWVVERCEQHRQDKHRRGPSTPRPKRCSPDKFVRRFAQDDDCVGVLKKSIP